MSRNGYCVHGVYTGGCGIDCMCGRCEDGHTMLARNPRPSVREDYVLDGKALSGSDKGTRFELARSLRGDRDTFTDYSMTLARHSERDDNGHVVSRLQVTFTCEYRTLVINYRMSRGFDWIDPYGELHGWEPVHTCDQSESPEPTSTWDCGACARYRHIADQMIDAAN